MTGHKTYIDLYDLSIQDLYQKVKLASLFIGSLRYFKAGFSCEIKVVYYYSRLCADVCLSNRTLEGFQFSRKVFQKCPFAVYGFYNPL